MVSPRLASAGTPSKTQKVHYCRLSAVALGRAISGAKSAIFGGRRCAKNGDAYSWEHPQLRSGRVSKCRTFSIRGTCDRQGSLDHSLSPDTVHVIAAAKQCCADSGVLLHSGNNDKEIWQLHDEEWFTYARILPALWLLAEWRRFYRFTLNRYKVKVALAASVH